MYVFCLDIGGGGGVGGIPMIRRLMPIWPPEVGTNTSHRMS